MKAITLWQPFAQLVALGAKQLETRSWATSYRGPIAIHAAKAFPAGARALVGTEPFWSALVSTATEHAPGTAITYCFRYHEHNLPRAAVVATARLAACCELVELADKRVTLHPIGAVDNVSEGLRALFGAGPSRPFPALERAFGDFTPGRFAWVLEDVARLEEPPPATGRQGLWEWDELVRPRARFLPVPTTADHPPESAPSSDAPPTPTTAAPPPPSRWGATEAAAGLLQVGTPDAETCAAALATAVLDEWDRFEGCPKILGPARVRLASAIARGFVAVGRAFAREEATR